jgi:hypothetical protein
VVVAGDGCGVRNQWLRCQKSTVVDSVRSGCGVTEEVPIGIQQYIKTVCCAQKQYVAHRICITPGEGEARSVSVNTCERSVLQLCYNYVTVMFQLRYSYVAVALPFVTGL